VSEAAAGEVEEGQVAVFLGSQKGSLRLDWPAFLPEWQHVPGFEKLEHEWKGGKPWRSVSDTTVANSADNVSAQRSGLPIDSRRCWSARSRQGSPRKLGGYAALDSLCALQRSINVGDGQTDGAAGGSEHRMARDQIRLESLTTIMEGEATPMGDVDPRRRAGFDSSNGRAVRRLG
jgi:hypothetical protein